MFRFVRIIFCFAAVVVGLWWVTGVRAQPSAAGAKASDVAEDTPAPAGAAMVIATDADETGPIPAEVFPDSPPSAKPLPAVELQSEASIDAGAAPAARTNSPAAVTSPRPREAAPTSPSDVEVPIEAATFNGLQPGESSAEDVTRIFGQPYEAGEKDGVSQQVFRFEPFDRVEVALSAGIVQSIMIQLDKPYERDALAKQLQLSDVRPAKVPDDSGNVLGYCYPERGVLFGTTPDSAKISHILLEPIDGMPFLLRAEHDLIEHPRRSLQDIERGLNLETSVARAYWLRARILTRAGRYAEALAASELCVEADLNDVRYQITHAEALAASDRDQAIAKLSAMVETDKLAPELQAKVQNKLAEFFGSGPAPDYGKAMEYHMAAIQTAQEHAASQDIAVRRAAKEVLIDAHLGAARAIAQGQWQQKEKAIPRWLVKATQLTDDLVDHEGAPEDLRLRTSAAAVSIAAALNGKLDAVRWVATARETGDKIVAESADEWRRAQAHWSLGLALAGAAEVAFAGRRFDEALNFSQSSLEHLEDGQSIREAHARDEHLVAQVCFRIGAIHSVHRQDHATAVTWFDKAADALASGGESALPVRAGERGEALVGMAVSYWTTGQRDRAMELTESGANLIAAAVEARQLSNEALTVPYGNLVSMYQATGNQQKAREFAALAEKNRAGKVQQAAFEQP